MEADLDRQDSIIISQAGAFLGWAAAELAHRHGWLKKFITPRQVRKVLPWSKVQDLSCLEFPGRALRWMNGKIFHSKEAERLLQKYNYNHFKVWIDKLVASQINDQIKILHLFSCGYPFSIQRCQERGIHTIVDYGIVHVDFFDAMMQEETALMKFDPYQKKDHTAVLQELDQMDAISVASEFVEKSFREAGYLKNNLWRNPYGVDIDFFKPGAEKRRNLKVIKVMTAGMLGLRKGTYYLLEAVRRLRAKNVPVELYLFGNPDAEFARRIVTRYRDIISYIGTVPHSALRMHYQNADVFVLPSLVEGFARVVLEAMACGTPCIVTPNTGHEQTVDEGIDGFVVPVRDIDALENRLMQLYENPALNSDMGKAARKKAEQHSWQHYQERLRNMYNSAFAGKLDPGAG